MLSGRLARMKKPILAFLAGGLAVLAIAAAYPRTQLAQNESLLRYQIRDTENIVVIDTQTGEVWRHQTNWKSLGKPEE